MMGGGSRVKAKSQNSVDVVKAKVKELQGKSVCWRSKERKDFTKVR